MSNVIRFLESMGSDPSLARLSATDYANVVAALDVDEAQRQALHDRNATALNDLLGGRHKMYCAQFPGKEDQPAKRDDEPEEDKPDDGDDDEASSLSRHRPN
jgi:hypothetical protein